MKVVAFKSNFADSLYGEGYGTEFFDNLWKENLESCEQIDEVVYATTPPMNDKNFNQLFADIVGDADATIGIFIPDDLINEELFKKCPNLKYIATSAHGYGKFDYEATKKYNVTLSNTIYGDVTIAQFAMGLLLDLCHNIEVHSNYYKHEKWEMEKPPIKMIKTRQFELYGKTIGIYGLGNIGLKVAEMAQGFGMNVIGYSRTKKTEPEYDFIKQVSFEELLKSSDVISIHCPLTEATKNSIDAKAIEKMKDGVLIVNTARGAIIDEEALYNALKSKKVLGAGLDVVCGEPLTAPCKLMECENAKITEHIAWLTIESRIRSNKMLCDNLIGWINGNPQSVFNK